MAKRIKRVETGGTGKKGGDRGGSPPPKPQPLLGEVASRWFTDREREEVEGLLKLLRQVEEGWGVTILGLFLNLYRCLEGGVEEGMGRLQIAQLLHRQSRHFFQGIEGFRSPYRREILVEVGKILTEKLPGFQFLSPEEWQVVDPNLHRVVRGDGVQIERGLSFVVKGERGGTLFYGEVESYSQ